MNHEELVLNAALTRINERITHYVLRVMDEASGHGTTEYAAPIGEVEYALGGQMIELVQELQASAATRGLVVIEGGAIQGTATSRQAAETAEGVNVSETALLPPPVLPALNSRLRRKPDIPEF